MSDLREQIKALLTPPMEYFADPRVYIDPQKAADAIVALVREASLSEPIESTPMDDNCAADMSKERTEAAGLSVTGCLNPFAASDPIMPRVVATIAAVRQPDETIVISNDVLNHVIALVRSDERNKTMKNYVQWDTTDTA